MRGFTTVRDLAGPSFALKRAIDDGSVVGPSHLPLRRDDLADLGPRRYRNIWELPGGTGELSRAEQLGAAAIADGRDAVLRATREQLMKGASQIKIVAGGGVSRTSTRST